MSSSSSTPTRKISFPLEAVFQSAVQDADNEELWRLLHEFSTDIDVNEPNHAGLTPLHYSVLANNLDGVKMLLGFGASVNIPDCHGYTPLHTAAACGYLQMVSYLVVFGADVFATTEDGDLPADLAKDTNTATLLTDQMVLRIHRTEYVNSWLIYQSKELIRTILHLVTLLFCAIVSFISGLFSELLDNKRGNKHPPCDTQHNGKKD